jgi:hypothetical protein
LSAYEEQPARTKPSDTIAGFLSTMAMAICLIGLAWHPLRLILPGIALAMVSAGMAGPRSRRIAFVGVLVATACFFFGMLIAVIAQHPLW